MNQDVERLLHQSNPPGVPPELRARVLLAVAAELTSTQPTPSRRPPILAIALAASLLVALSLNIEASRRLDRRLALVLGPPPVHKQAAAIADDVASITDPATGRWVYQHLSARPPEPADPRRYALRLHRFIQQLTVNTDEEPAVETLQKGPQGRRDRHGRLDRPAPARQRLFRLDHRLPA